MGYVLKEPSIHVWLADLAHHIHCSTANVADVGEFLGCLRW